jgi:gliding motility-associated-like protein
MFNKYYKTQGRFKSLLCVFFINTLSLQSQILQNLINNPSFEDTVQCPTTLNQLNYSKNWFDPVTLGSPDFFNSCSTNSNISTPINFTGKQTARTGNAYSGISPYVSNITSNFREYIKNKLKNSLSSNKSYCLTFYVSLSDSSSFAISNLGASFSNDSLVITSGSTPYLINAIPNIENSTVITDSLNWTQIQGIYLSNGTENFVTIGNFRDDANTQFLQVKPLNPPSKYSYSYYFVDDVSLIEINNANASILDTVYTRCSLDSVRVGTDSTEFANYSWQAAIGGSGLSSLSCTNCPNPIAKPTLTTKYYLTKQQCSAITMDSVVVMVKTPTVIANAGPDRVVCPNEVLQLSSDSIPYVFYGWSSNTPGSNFTCLCANPQSTIEFEQTFILIAQDCGITKYDSMNVTIDDCFPTYTVPNVFSPNYDNVNDTWGVKFSSIGRIKDFSMHIYDRWGLEVFASPLDYQTPNIRWDGHTSAGEECSNGTYFYVISFKKNDEEQKLKGFLSLFR